MEHKGGHWLVHEECIVHTAVYQKALKQHRTVKKSSLGKIEADVWVILLCGPCLLLGRPYYELLLWFMIICI